MHVKVFVKWIAVLFLVGGGWAVPVQGQEAGNGPQESIDQQLFRAVYDVEAPLMRSAMRTADTSFDPVFYGSLVAAWGGAWLTQGGDNWSSADAYRFTLAHAATHGINNGLKALMQRSRPHWAMQDITARESRYRPDGPDSSSFPSGHAAMSFAIATSLSLSHPEWYVIVPSAAWATTVSVSRIWLGVHYPGDVVAGMVLGVGVSTAVHLLGDTITPTVFRSDETEVTLAPPLTLRVRW